jgi:hypothetical protein
MSQTKQVIFNGMPVGELPWTGDLETDWRATREWLEAHGHTKGTWNKPRMMHMVASGFMSTALDLFTQVRDREPSKGAPLAAVPCIVNLAFAIEVFLKIIAEVHGKTLWGHDLVKLYKALPPAGRSAIDEASPVLAPRYSAASAGKPFRELLRPIATAFEQWRYTWDRSNEAKPVTFIDAIAVLYVVHTVATSLLWPTAELGGGQAGGHP